MSRISDSGHWIGGSLRRKQANRARTLGKADLYQAMAPSPSALADCFDEAIIAARLYLGLE